MLKAAGCSVFTIEEAAAGRQAGRLKAAYAATATTAFTCNWFWGSSALYLHWSLCCGPAINMDGLRVSHEGLDTGQSSS